MRITQFVYVSPLAPYALLLVSAISFLAGASNTIGLLQLIYLAYRGGDPVVRHLSGHGAAAVVVPVLIAGLAFAGGMALRRMLKEQTDRQQQYPDQPWMWRRDWSERRIRLNSIGPTVAVIVLCVTSLYYFAWLAGMYVAGKGPDSYWFPAAVAVATFFGIRLYSVNRKWRHSELKLETLPGMIGGPFRAVILLSETFADGIPFQVTLVCEHSTWSTSTKRSGIHTNTLWRGEMQVDPQRCSESRRRTLLPVSFDLPAHLPASMPRPVREGPLRRQKTSWWLSVSLKDDPRMRSVRFEVPIFSPADARRAPPGSRSSSR